jgi:hypothetical protein
MEDGMGSKGKSWANLFAGGLARLARPFQGRSRNVLIALVSVAALLLVPYFAWRKWGPELTSHERFRLSAENIEVTPQPAWIHSDVRAEVIRDGSLDQLPILDEQVTVKVASAFALHNWVANVKRVSKYPGPRLVVDLEYRRPVAMVEISRGGARGLLPIDATGVLLPTEDFSPNQTRNFLRVAAGETTPAGLVGTNWGDERIAGSARLAELLETEWRRVGLYRIAVLGERESVRRRAAPLYELQSRKGSRVVWGHAPGQEVSGEAKGAEKLARLLEFVEQNGPFDSGGAAVEIDLREGRPMAVAPQPAPPKSAASRSSGRAPEAALPARPLIPLDP